jgi:hypothetical protein
MKMADILRQLADKLDGIEGDNTGNQASDFQHEVDQLSGSDTGLEQNPVMIPPLQQKLEILKKSAGMDNAMDSGSDELDDIKKLTGINAVIASEDNDITG